VIVLLLVLVIKINLI